MTSVNLSGCFSFSAVPSFGGSEPPGPGGCTDGVVKGGERRESSGFGVACSYHVISNCIVV